jgi:hypothetical protein
MQQCVLRRTAAALHGQQAEIEQVFRGTCGVGVAQQEFLVVRDRDIHPIGTAMHQHQWATVRSLLSALHEHGLQGQRTCIWEAFQHLAFREFLMHVYATGTQGPHRLVPHLSCGQLPMDQGQMLFLITGVQCPVGNQGAPFG